LASGTVRIEAELSATEAGADAWVADGVVVAEGTIAGAMSATEGGADSFAATGAVEGAAPATDTAAAQAGTGGGPGTHISLSEWVRRLTPTPDAPPTPRPRGLRRREEEALL
jgi:hypothetical protein